MRLLLVLLLKSAMGQHLIQLKEKDLVGEDMQLAVLLKRRTSHGGFKLSQIQLPKQYHDNTRIYKEIKQSLEASARRNWRFHEPGVRDMKERTIELMQTAIYLTQYRMAHLAEVTKRYSSDIRFRVAYIFCRLDTLLREMRIMFSVQNNSLTAKYQYYDRNVHECLIYYTYFLKKNIDITYIVEHMTALHIEHTLSHSTNASTTLSPEVGDANSTGGSKEIDEASSLPPLISSPPEDE